MAMTMTDPIADMLARLRNANSAYHDAVTMPRSFSAPPITTPFHASALASVPETRRSGVKPLPIALSP